MKKQTAVEWYYQQTIVEAKTNYAELLEQAKAMEKEQMWDYIKKHYVIGENTSAFHKEEFEKYYNETYT